jgi:hypothetical protein
MKQYLVVAYAYLVKVGKYDLDVTEGSVLSVVPETYRDAVATYLVTSNPV